MDAIKEIITIANKIKTGEKLSKGQRIAIINTHNFINYDVLDNNVDVNEECQDIVSALPDIGTKLENNEKLTANEQEIMKAIKDHLELRG